MLQGVQRRWVDSQKVCPRRVPRQLDHVQGVLLRLPSPLLPSPSPTLCLQMVRRIAGRRQLPVNQGNQPHTHLRALKVQAPQVKVHQQVLALALAWVVPQRMLSSRQCLWCPCCISLPFSSVVSLNVLVVLHGAAGTQRLKLSATRTLKQASTADCYDNIVPLVPLLAPAAS